MRDDSLVSLKKYEGKSEDYRGGLWQMRTKVQEGREEGRKEVKEKC